MVNPRQRVEQIIVTLRDVTTAQRDKRDLTVLASLSGLTRDGADMTGTLQTLASLLVPAFVDGCVIDVLNAAGGVDVSACAFCDPVRQGAFIEFRRRYPPRLRPGHPTWEVLRSGATLFIPQIEPSMVASLAATPDEQLLASRAMPASSVHIPLVVAGRVLGVAALATYGDRPRLDAADVALAEEIGRRAAEVIGLAQAYRTALEVAKREEAQAARLRLLADRTRDLARVDDEYPAILTAVARIVTSVIGSGCVICVTPPSAPPASGVHHTDAETGRRVSEEWQRLMYARPEWLAGLDRGDGPQVLTEEELAAFRAQLSDVCADGVAERQLRSVALMPLRCRDVRFGTVLVWSDRDAHAFSDSDIGLLGDLADRASYTVDSARLLDERRRAIEARDAIIQVVSHDVANPLNTVIGSMSFLMATEHQAAERRIFARVHRAAERASSIMRDLLDYATVQSGHLTLVLEPVDAAVLVNEVCEMFEPQADSVNVTLTCDNADSALVTADRGRMMQVLANIVSNALKFTPAGGAVHIGLRRLESSLTIAISDTGAGIPEFELSQVFKRFFQGQLGLHRGAGLGLAISEAIVMAHRGHISVASVVDSGTTVTVHLPLPSAGALPFTDECPSATAPLSS